MDWFRRFFKPSAQVQQSNALADWRIVSAKNATLGNAVIRIRIRQPEVNEISAYATAVEIAWPYESADGMPPSDVNQRQLTFERALDDLTGENRFSELVQVSTGRSVKEWLFYTTSRERFMGAFNELLAKHERYPLNIKFYDDPKWEIWQQTANFIKQRERDV
jgi:hypothetical protein